MSSTNSRPRSNRSETVRRTVTVAAVISGPMPSPGSTRICILDSLFEHDLRANASRLSRGKPVPTFPDHALAPFEVRRPALFGGLDAFLEIFGGAKAGLFGQFVVGGGQHAVGEAFAHRGAGRKQAERRTFGNFRREFHCRGPHLILRHAFIRKAHFVSLLAGDAAA